MTDADKRNSFDVEKYLEHKLVFSQNTEFEVYEVNVTEEDVKEAEQNISCLLYTSPFEDPVFENNIILTETERFYSWHTSAVLVCYSA